MQTFSLTDLCIILMFCVSLKHIHLKIRVGMTTPSQVIMSLSNIPANGLAILIKDSLHYRQATELHIPSELEAFGGYIEAKTPLFVAVIYRPSPFPRRNFLAHLRTPLEQVPISHYRTVITGDFNMDQTLSSPNALIRIMDEFQLKQYVNKLTHALGSSLYLMFSNEVIAADVFPVPYLDHHVLLPGAVVILYLSNLTTYK